MKRGMVHFKELIKKTFCGLPAFSRSSLAHAVATWLAASALIGSASMALSAPPRDFFPDARPERPRQASAPTTQRGTGPSAQNLVPGQWTWVSGSSYVAEQVNFGTYGAKGLPDLANSPDVRSGSVSWTDASGNLWLFGGSGYSASSSGYLNDLWKFNISTGQWTWISGSNGVNQDGTYGTKGVAAPGNVPGARSDSVSWTDTSGNFWLFGGGHAPNDLWKFDISTGLWTWVSGSNEGGQRGSYGTLGVPAASNVPGARSGSVSWTDRSGNLWLFGGFGYSASYSAFLNDLWKYSVASGEWTWVSGSNSVNQHGTYGTLGTPVPTNVPGARDSSVSWTDGSGNLWLFGGYSPLESMSGLVNDLWKFSTTSGQWTWISGSNAPDEVGTYGALGTPAATNVPGARYSSVSWTDGSGNLWLFGGAGHASANRYGWLSYEYLNDLWKFSISTRQWTWVSGSNQAEQAGSYGERGMAAPGNVPGARYSSISWADGSGHLWLFGGIGYGSTPVLGTLNDLWVYTLPTEFSATSPLWLVPGVVWSSGQGGAEWQSDLSIFNPSPTSPVTLQLAFLDATKPIGSIAELDGRWKMTSISPQATVAFSNVVSSLFNLAKGSYGAILVREEVDASAQPVLSGKTYDVSRGAAGTVGLCLPAAKLPSGAGAGIQAYRDPVDLIGLRDDATHYTNLSVANLYNDYVMAEVTFFGPDGNQLGQSVTMQLNPFGVQQLTNVLSAAPPAGAGYDKASNPVASYRARVRIVSGTAILPYASIVDDVSKDPVLVTGANVPVSSYRTPGIVRTTGRANTFWRSDLVITNPSASARSVRVVYSWVDGSETGHASAESIPLAPGQILQWIDFVKLWLSLPDTDTGSFINSFVDVSPADANADPLLVIARVYNTQPSGNVGLGVPGFTASDAASGTGTNIRLAFPGLRSDANFRSNLALFLASSSGGSSAGARIEVYDASGTLLVSAPIWLGVPNSFAQVSIDDLIASVTGDKSNVSVVVDNLTGSPISGYATIVDNRSGDGSLVPGTPLP